MLIATLPSIHNEGLIEEIFSSPLIGGARYNTGTRSGLSPEETLHRFSDIAERYDKKFWVDLKGRQLRITKWADPTYGDIELNREIEVKLPAKILFRNDPEQCTLVKYRGNKLFVTPNPFYVLGAGQAVNIISDNLEIKDGYLAPNDVPYVRAAKDMGLHDYMLSFIEEESDVAEVKAIDPEANPVLKIESVKGLGYVAREYNGRYQLMAARDDLSVNLGNDEAGMNNALKLIVERDPEAIAASRIFQSLKTQDWISYSDIEDIRNLKGLGYKNFMFDDTISHRHFRDAIKFWQWWGV